MIKMTLPEPHDPEQLCGSLMPASKKKINPSVPRVQKIKIRNLMFNRLPIVEFVEKMVYLGAHYSVSARD